MEHFKNFTIRVENKFKEGERSLLVYSSSEEKDFIIPWPKDAKKPEYHDFEIPPKCPLGKENYLLLTVSPRLNKKDKDKLSCKIDLPGEAKIKFIPIEENHIDINPCGDRTVMRIEESAPTWQLKITRPDNLGSCKYRTVRMFALPLSPNPEEETPDTVTVGDNGEG